MDDKLKILLCEDDENLGMLLREYLAAKGYEAELCADGEAGYKAFLKTKFDICVLDVMMPKKDGFTLAQEIRQANAEMPIIFLTAKTLKDDILEGFKIGADDYITKPFSMEELVFRIEAILRRVRGKKNKESTLYHIGKFTIGANVTGQGKTWWDEANTYAQKFYAVLGAHADYELKCSMFNDQCSMVISLWGKNLTDTKYNTFAIQSSAAGGTRYFAQKANPIQIGMDVNIHF